MTDRCQQVSAGLDEPLPGTAATAAAWVLVEDDGPWGREALPASGVPAHVASSLGGAAAAAGVRVQMIRRLDRQRRDADRRTVFLCHSGPGAPWARRLLLADDELAALDLRSARAPTPPADLGEPVEDDLLLVCTHAKRDACCAQFGRPVAEATAALAPERTWETSHTGGHRFAGVMLVLPEGLALGRLTPADVAAVVDDLGSGRVPMAHYRGRSADLGPGQAAEVAVRRETGVEGRSSVRVTEVRRDGGAHVVGLRVEGRPWRAVVASRPLGTLRALSCGGQPEDRLAHEVVAVGPADA